MSLNYTKFAYDNDINDINGQISFKAIPVTQAKSFRIVLLKTQKVNTTAHLFYGHPIRRPPPSLSSENIVTCSIYISYAF